MLTVPSITWPGLSRGSTSSLVLFGLCRSKFVAGKCPKPSSLTHLQGEATVTVRFPRMQKHSPVYRSISFTIPALTHFVRGIIWRSVVPRVNIFIIIVKFVEISRSTCAQLQFPSVHDCVIVTVLTVPLQVPQHREVSVQLLINVVEGSFPKLDVLVSLSIFEYPT